MSEENINKFKEKLSELDWDSLYVETDAQKAFTLWHSTFLDIYNKCFPIKRFKHGYKTRHPWLTPNLKKCIKTKNKLFIKCKRNQNEEEYVKYKIYRNNLNTILRKAERDHYHELLIENKSNMRKSWKVMKTIINKNKKINKTPKFFIRNQMTSDNETIAEAFNSFFVNIGYNLAKNIPDSGISATKDIQSVNETIMIMPTCDSEIMNIIKTLKNSSPGWDDINVNVIKHSSLYIVKPLTHLLNLSLSTGIVPKELKSPE
jgi:hypothetical protein